MSWSLIEYEGKVAVALNWMPEEKEPVETRPIWYSPKDRWDEKYYSQFTQVNLMSNSQFQCFSNITYRSHPLNTTGWIMVNQSRPIPKPGRDGPKNVWRWSTFLRRWVKEPRGD